MKDTETGVADESTPIVKRIGTTSRSRVSDDGLAKWSILALCCSIISVMYYLLAMPAGLHRQLRTIMPSENFEMNFNLLFTVSYFPNMFLPFFGGAVVDEYGQAKCLVLFCILVFLGQVLVTLGVCLTSWKIMLAGRLVFGLGAQNLIVANASLISKWFVGNEGIALGLSNVCSYAGVIATNVLSPILANSIGLSFAFALGVAMEAIAIALGWAVIVLDRNEKPSKSLRSTTADVSSLVCSPMYSPMAIRHSVSRTTLLKRGAASPGVIWDKKQTRESTIGAKLRSFHPAFWLLCLSFLLVYGVVWSFTNVSSAILLERDFFVSPPSDCVPKHPKQCTSGSLVPIKGNPSLDSNGKECPIGDKYAPPLPRSLNVTIHGTDYMFDPLHSSSIQCNDDFWALDCTQSYCEIQAAATEKAGLYMSIPYFFTVLLTFHLGLLVDATGWRTQMICLGSVLLVIAHALLAYPSTSPLFPLAAQGLGYTISVAALWPSIPFTVSDDSVGTAFGVMMSVQNFGLAIIPLIVARLFSSSGDRYLPRVELFFVALSILAVVVGFVLVVLSRSTEKVLMTPKPKIRFNDENGTFVVASRPRANSVPITL